MKGKIYTIILWVIVGVGVVGVLGFFLPIEQGKKGASFLLVAIIMYLLFNLAGMFDPRRKRKLK